MGYDREHMMGTSPLDFMDHDNTEIFREEFGKRFTTGNRTYEIQMRSNDGKVHDVIINATNLKYIEGRPAGTFAMITDISGLKQINSELEREKIRSNTFLDLLSHDIGNIHQGILLSASILDQNRMDESIKMRSLANIRNLANRSIHLVKNVILLTRLDSIDMDPREIDVVDMIERSVGSCRSVFPDRTIRHDTICQHESVMLEVEPIVGEVFFNLYHNSIKVQEREDPRIRTEVIVDRERSCVRVLISDWGPGIPDELKERLLYRTRKPGDKVHSGIGFSLVRELMKRYNGTIRIMDGNGVDQGPGACFELIFPLIDSK
jgi:signal transduction histidine kinase